jgi:hypothetical protein
VSPPADYYSELQWYHGRLWPRPPVNNALCKGATVILAEGIAKTDMDNQLRSILEERGVPTSVMRVGTDVVRTQALVNRTQALVNRTKALVNRTQALVNRTQALVNRSQALVNRTQALVIRTQVCRVGDPTTIVDLQRVAAHRCASPLP